MLSHTLTEGLERYRIGPKVRTLRLNKKLGLVQLGQHTGLSPAMLSKIERGQLFPTLPTLLRIAMVFGVGLEHFFSDAEQGPKVAVIRKHERLRLPEQPGTPSPAYIFESLDFPVANRSMEAYYAEFQPDAGPSAPHRHEGAEFIYVIEGRLAVEVEGTTTLLDQGDAMYFDPAAAHSYSGEGKAACKALVVVTPQ